MRRTIQSIVQLPRCKAVALRAAILAGIAWTLLPLRVSTAQEIFERPADATMIVNDYGADPGAYAPIVPETFDPDPPTLVHVTDMPQEMAATPPKKWSRLCSFFPEGSIPYIGPRTPDSRKNRGIGQPIAGRGWRSQPFSISGFAGATDGDALISGRVYQNVSFYGGVNFSWDYDHYWGIEKRLGFGALSLNNGQGQPISDTGLSVTGEYRIMYYPLGDARWRPFLTAGVGWSDFYYNDDLNKTHLDTVGMIPFGLGVKYLWTERIAVRVDLIDEFTFGTGDLSNFHYVALVSGVEFRYGQRLLKMPWHRDGS
jgi:hypothetical protein